MWRNRGVRQDEKKTELKYPKGPLHRATELGLDHRRLLCCPCIRSDMNGVTLGLNRTVPGQGAILPYLYVQHRYLHGAVLNVLSSTGTWCSIECTVQHRYMVQC
jgi:hypothetical protein